MIKKRNQSEKKQKKKKYIMSTNYNFDIKMMNDNNLEDFRNKIEEPLNKSTKLKKYKSLPEYKRKY